MGYRPEQQKNHAIGFKIMRYYLDTNILIFLFSNPKRLDSNILEIISDCTNTFYTSSVCVMETIQVFLTNKTEFLQKKDKNKKEDIFKKLEKYDIIIKYTTLQHLKLFAEMPVLHSDPNDRLIIAQAASDRITLISSDTQFPLYATKMRNFNFILNKQ